MTLRENIRRALRIGRTFAGKIVLPSEPATKPTALPGDANGAAAASTLPASASPSDAGHSPVGSSRCDDRTAQRAVPTIRKSNLP